MRALILSIVSGLSKKTPDAATGCGTGILPVFHGRDAHATRRCGTGILPVFHGRDAHATDGADHGKKIETVISIVAEAAMAIKSLLRAA